MPLSSIPEQTKKIITLWLLAGSCITAFLILLLYPVEQPYRLQNLNQTDSLILQELALLNVTEERIRTFQYQVNDHFTRKRFVVDLPPNVSKTRFHAELNRQLRPWQIKTVGYVDVPEQEMTLYILYQDKIIRTLDLRSEAVRLQELHPADHL